MRLTKLSGCAGPRGCCLIAVVLAVAGVAEGEDWPAWLGNQNRSGSSEEKLAGELKPAWVWQSRHAPSPALAPPRGSAKRGGLGEPFVQTSTSDNAFQVVVAGGKLYFGSSVEESVTCLNAADGRRFWTFYSEGAIRFAPLCDEGKVYFGSDDGYVYCIDGASGELIWKFQAAIGKRRIIANGRISSQWPVRTGLAMRDNVIYAACGVFPSEDRGVMVYALAAASGKPVWKERFRNHAAGYLLAQGESLLIPTGRSSPRAMSRSDGSGQPPALGGREGEGGGSPCLVSGMLIYGPNENGFLKVRPTPDAPEQTTGLQGWRVVADAERIFVLRNDGIHAVDKVPFTKALVASCRAFGSKEEAKERALQWQQRLGIRQLHLKRHQQGRDEPLLIEDMRACTVWNATNEAGLVSMIRAGDVIVTGGKGIVQTHSTKDGTRLWSSKVDGTVWDLAVADGALFASTDTGAVYCFRKDGAGTVAKPQQPPRIPFAYNGTMLWGLDVPGSLRLGVGHESGQACVDSDYLYVAATNDCWLIDAATGAKTRAYVVPDGKSDWGYVAIVGDLLVGSSQSPKATYNIQNPVVRRSYGGKPGSRVRTIWGDVHNTQVVSTDLFALGKNDGAKRWQYNTGSHILNSSVASDGRAVFLVESRNAALPGAEDGIVFLKEFFEKDAVLVALDLKTGVKQWDKPFVSEGEEVFYLSCTEGALLTVTSANTPFEGPERDKEKNYYQFRLFDAKNGSERWSTSVVGGKEGFKHGVNIQPAVIMGDKAYLSMRTGGRLFTFDLTTGECTETPRFRSNKGCGVMTGSRTTLFFRNMASQAYDTVSGQTFWTSSISRPSCWLNDIPAGGLVLMPEASTGCDCAFAMQVSIVLAPRADAAASPTAEQVRSKGQR